MDEGGAITDVCWLVVVESRAIEVPEVGGRRQPVTTAVVC